jgi:hypothetical protein
MESDSLCACRHELGPCWGDEEVFDSIQLEDGDEWSFYVCRGHAECVHIAGEKPDLSRYQTQP